MIFSLRLAILLTTLTAGMIGGALRTFYNGKSLNNCRDEDATDLRKASVPFPPRLLSRLRV